MSTHTSTPRTAHMYLLDQDEIRLAIRAMAWRISRSDRMAPGRFTRTMVAMTGEAIEQALDGRLDRTGCVSVNRALHEWIDDGDLVGDELAGARRLADRLFDQRMIADRV